MNFSQLFRSFAQIKVAVIGDVMLDTYWWGSVNRISPEAPVPIVVLQKNELRLGGAANVALNLVSLQAQTTVISVIGNDAEGNTLKQLLENENINTNYIVQSLNRITTNKTRILSRNQQMMRLDAEITSDLDANTEEILLHNIEKYITAEKPAVIVLQDYNKGVLTQNIITKTIALCKQHNVITTVDPKRKNFFNYVGVDIFKPNLAEVKDGLNILLDEINELVLKNIHQQLQAKLMHHISFITLSEKGVFYNSENACKVIPTHIRNIADVSGAGDTVISVASLIYAATKDILLAAEIANIAGGLVCEEVGTVAIDKEKLLGECERLIGSNSPSSCIISKPFNNHIKKFVDTTEWTFARTMPEWPHEYIVRERVDETIFTDMVKHIRTNGYEGKFYAKSITYFDQEGYTYWTMGAPIEETIIINRTQKENSYEERLKNGTLPK